MQNTKSADCRQQDDEMYMRNLTWLVAILFVMSAVGTTSPKHTFPFSLEENEQVAAYGAVLGLAMWPKLKRIFGV